MRKMEFIFIVIFLIVFALILYSIAVAMLDEDIPPQFKIFMVVFIIFAVLAFVSTIVKRYKTQQRPVSSETRSLIDMERRTTEEGRCMLCYTKTNEPVCPKCGNRIK